MLVTSEAKTLSSDSRIMLAIEYATKASIYPERTAAELTTAQTIIISILYALKLNDLQMIKSLLEASSTVPQINSSFLKVWLRDDFCFPRGDVAQCLSTLGQLLINGLQFPWAVAATLTSLSVKYRIQECFTDTDDAAGQILLSTLNTCVSEGTQVDFANEFPSQKPQTTLKKQVSFLLLPEKTSIGTQAGLIVHDRGISVRPEQSNVGIQTTDESPVLKPTSSNPHSITLPTELAKDQGVRAETGNRFYTFSHSRSSSQGFSSPYGQFERNPETSVKQEQLTPGAQNKTEGPVSSSSLTSMSHAFQALRKIMEETPPQPNPHYSYHSESIPLSQKLAKDQAVKTEIRIGLQASGEKCKERRKVNLSIIDPSTGRNIIEDYLREESSYEKNSEVSVRPEQLTTGPQTKTKVQENPRSSAETGTDFRTPPTYSNKFLTMPLQNRKQNFSRIIDPSTGRIVNDDFEDHNYELEQFERRFASLNPVDSSDSDSDSIPFEQKLAKGLAVKTGISIAYQATGDPKKTFFAIYDPTGRDVLEDYVNGRKKFENEMKEETLPQPRPVYSSNSDSILASQKLAKDQAVKTEIKIGSQTSGEKCKRQSNPMSIIGPSSGRNCVEDYLSEKPVLPKFCLDSSFTKDQAAKIEDGPKHLIGRTDPDSNKKLPVSKGMAKELLYSAIQKNDAKSIVSAINAGADVNDEGIMKKRPLHIAASAGRIEPAIELIHWGADVDSLDNWGETPLFVASVAGHLLMAEVLIAAGANINHRNSEGNNPLHVAASAGQLEIVRLLLSSGVEVNCRSGSYRTPLHYAAFGGHLSVVGLLLDRGADPSATDKTGHTPLSLAKSSQQQLVADFLYYRTRQSTCFN